MLVRSRSMQHIIRRALLALGLLEDARVPGDPLRRRRLLFSGPFSGDAAPLLPFVRRASSRCRGEVAPRGKPLGSLLDRFSGVGR